MTPLVRHTAVGIAFALAAVSAAVQAQSIGKIAIDHPWARSTAPGQPAGGGYLKLDNQGPADRLVSASSPRAASVQLHTMSMDGDVMRMRQVDGIEVPAGGQVDLKPGGLHLMLLGLKAPLKAGDKFPMTLTFERAGSVVVQVSVETPNATGGAASAAGHTH